MKLNQFVWGLFDKEKKIIQIFYLKPLGFIDRFSSEIVITTCIMIFLAVPSFHHIQNSFCSLLFFCIGFLCFSWQTHSVRFVEIKLLLTVTVNMSWLSRRLEQPSTASHLFHAWFLKLCRSQCVCGCVCVCFLSWCLCVCVTMSRGKHNVAIRLCSSRCHLHKIQSALARTHTHTHACTQTLESTYMNAMKCLLRWSGC